MKPDRKVMVCVYSSEYGIRHRIISCLIDSISVNGPLSPRRQQTKGQDKLKKGIGERLWWSRQKKIFEQALVQRMATKLLGDPVKQGQKLPGPGFDHIFMVSITTFFLEALKFLSHARSSTNTTFGKQHSKRRKIERHGGSPASFRKMGLKERLGLQSGLEL